MNSFVKTTCVKCKVYYGSEERNGMCSVCYKECNNEKEKVKPIEEVKKEENINVESKSEKIESLSKDSKGENDIEMKDTNEMEKNIKPVQTNKMSCWICNKRVGYLGFKCKCEYIFCGTHRHFSDHNCDFDYKSYDREKLARGNDLLNNASNNNKMIK